MATGTFYLRPSADISLGHSVYPTSLTAGYLAISEEVADDASTYISQGEGEATSVFSLSGTLPRKINSVTAVRLCFRAIGCGTASYAQTSTNPSMSINGNTVSFTLDSISKVSPYENYEDFIISSAEAATLFNNSLTGDGSFPETTLTLAFDYYVSDSDKTAKYFRITQAYIELECDYVPGLGIGKKVGGAWVQAQAAYQKVNGAWAEITEEECKTILKSNLIKT